MSVAALDVRGLGVDYAMRGGRLRALSDISFSLVTPQTLGIVGESGSGKSTLARAVLRLLPRVQGEVRWRGVDLYGLDAASLRRQRRELQVVFQNPLASLDPRLTVSAIVGEPLQEFRPELLRGERSGLVAHTLVRVGLSAEYMNRYPHELSGGQCQRVAIARAIISGPRLLVCDEPLSALDVSVQAQIVNLLGELRQELGLALVFISHNLAVVQRVAHRVLVLYLGRTMELAERAALFAAPRHPYTRLLLDSVPAPDPERARRSAPVAAGEPGSALNPPAGCVFHPRCPFAVERCRREVPVLENAGEGRQVACHRWRELEQGS
jgi:oligopeptide transport system ATP-binding protein